jgi:hypothetical protein
MMLVDLMDKYNPVDSDMHDSYKYHKAYREWEKAMG